MRTSERSRVHTALASPSRVALVDLLRDSEHPLDAKELAELTGLHVSTVRFHLDALQEAGMVHTRQEHRSTRGRPRVLYEATTTSSASGGEVHTQLAQALARHWNDEGDAGSRAEAAGREWARASVPVIESAEGRGAEDVVPAVAALFAESGFEPETRTTPEGQEIVLHACPFAELAHEDQNVVCRVHLGLMRGALDRLGLRTTETSLIPWDTADTCLARIVPK